MVPVRITWKRPALDVVGLVRPDIDDGLLAVVALDAPVVTANVRLEPITEATRTPKAPKPAWRNVEVWSGPYRPRIENPRPQATWIPARPVVSEPDAILEVFPAEIVALIVAALPRCPARVAADTSHGAYPELLNVAGKGIYRGDDDLSDHVVARNADWLIQACGLTAEAALPLMPSSGDSVATLALLVSHEKSESHTRPGFVTEDVYATFNETARLAAVAAAQVAADLHRSKELLPYDLAEDGLIEVSVDLPDLTLGSDDPNVLGLGNGTEVFAVPPGLPLGANGELSLGVEVRTTGTVSLTRYQRAQAVAAPEQIISELIRRALYQARKRGYTARDRKAFNGDPRQPLARFHLRRFQAHVEKLAPLVLSPGYFDQNETNRARFALAALFGLVIAYAPHVSVANAVAITRKAIQAWVAKSGGENPIGRPRPEHVERDILKAIADQAPLWAWGELARKPSKAELVKAKLECDPLLWEHTVEAATKDKRALRTEEVWSALQQEGLIESEIPSPEHKSLISKALEGLGFLRKTSKGTDGARARGWVRNTDDASDVNASDEGVST